MTSQEEFVGVMSSSNWTWQRHTTGWNGLVSLRDHIHLFRDRDSLSSEPAGWSSWSILFWIQSLCVFSEGSQP